MIGGLAVVAIVLFLVKVIWGLLWKPVAPNWPTVGGLKTAERFAANPGACIEEALAKTGNRGYVCLQLPTTNIYVAQSPELMRTWYKAKESELSLAAAATALLDIAAGRDEKIRAERFGPLGSDSWNMSPNQRDWSAHWHDIIKGLLLSENGMARLHHVGKDMDSDIAEWPLEQTDLFQSVSSAVLKGGFVILCGRSLGRAEMERMCEVFWDLENGITDPIINMAPWLPAFLGNKLAHHQRGFGELCKMLKNVSAEKVDDSYLGVLFSQHQAKGFTEAQFHSDFYHTHSLTMQFAAHTNTAGTLGWSLLHLGYDKERLKRAQAEADSVDLALVIEGDRGEFRKLFNLPFIRACIYEIQV